MAEPQSQQPVEFRPVAALAGWLLPGLGHVISGDRARGIILCITIMSLWTLGLLIGGPTSLDRHTQPEEAPGAVDHPRLSLWYLGQMLMAPGVVFDQVQNAIPRGPDRGRQRLMPDKNPPFEPSFGRAFEQGQLFTALAGLLNLLVIIDVVYGKRRKSPQDTRAPAPPVRGRGGG